MGDYTDLKAKQLKNVHNSTLLVYSREKLGHMLSRKLKSEFSRVFFSSEIKDCLKLLGKNTNSNPDPNCVDIILIEFDIGSPKLIDYINKRPLTAETCSCDLIPTVVIFGEQTEREQESIEHIREVGGVTKMLRQPFTTQQVLMALMEALSMNKVIDQTFRDLKKAQVAAAKYPHIGVFDAKTVIGSKAKAEGDSDGSRSGSSFISGLEHKVEEINEAGSQCESVLPHYLHKFSRVPTCSSPKDILASVSTMRALPHMGSSKSLLIQSISNNSKKDLIDKAAPNKDNKSPPGSPTHIQQRGDKSDQLVPTTSILPGVKPLDRNYGSLDDPSVDSKSFAEELYGDEPSIVKVEETSTNYDPHLPPIQRLFDPEKRPFWNDTTTNSHSNTNNKAPKNPQYEIGHFVDKPRPNTTMAVTVGGLDKKTMDFCWKKVKSKIGGPNNSGSISRAQSSRNMSSLDLLGTTGGGLTPLASVDSLPLGEILAESTVRPLSAKALHFHGMGSPEISGKPPIQKKANIKNSESKSKRSSVASRSVGSVGSGFRAIQKATNDIALITREARPDYQVSNLIELDISKRRINLGEKAMLERGLGLESDGDIESAAICYSRSGMHSKDQQISHILLGNMHYRKNHLMSALRYYDSAIDILNAKPEGLKVVEDEFIAYFNRSIINFRLGADEDGLRDMEMASKINPNHLRAIELCSLAKRRMGMFSQAVEEAVKAKERRGEILRKRTEMREKALEKQIEEAMQQKRDTILMSQNGMDSSKGSRKASLADPEDVELALLLKTSKSLHADPLDSKIVVQVPDEVIENSLNDMIQQGLLSIKGDLEEINHTDGGLLKAFKTTLGMKQELFDEIFHKPTELQTALLVEPRSRTPIHLDIIAAALSRFPLLHNVSKSSLLDIAAVIEYRTLLSKEVLFKQGIDSTAVCFLLSGLVQSRMDLSSQGTLDVILDDVREFSTFGDIDLLFHKPKSKFIKAVEECLVVPPPAAAAASTGIGISKDGAMKKGSVYSTDNLHENSIEESSVATGIDNESYIRHLNEFNVMWNPDSGVLSRSLQPGMFMTYTMQSACEMMMIDERDFTRLLWDHAVSDFQSRLRVIKSSNVFKGWNSDDLIRLARMGQIISVKRGETVLKQGEKPNYLYIIMSGMCKVVKRPNRTEQLIQKLSIAKEQAERYDMKYVFHHKKILQDPNSSPDEETGDKSGKANKHSEEKLRFASGKELKAFSTEQSTIKSKLTGHEKKRLDLQAEIERLEVLIQKAKEQDLHDKEVNDRKEMAQKLAETTKSVEEKLGLKSATRMETHAAHTAFVLPKTKAQYDEMAAELSHKVADIAILQWPMIFGESCILDPEGGTSRGSVIADTNCRLFLIHKAQIQTFSINDEFLSRVKAKAAVYPGDPDLVVRLFRKQNWKQYRHDVMKDISTSRWPPQLKSVEPFHVC